MYITVIPAVVYCDVAFTVVYCELKYYFVKVPAATGSGNWLGCFVRYFCVLMRIKLGVNMLILI